MASKTSLQVSTNTGEITVKINDIFDLIVKSPMITQVFARAVAAVVTKTVGGVVTEIVVNIGQMASDIEFELHRQSVYLNANMLRSTTDIFAEEVRNAENNPNFPAPMREELKNRLYELFYYEMEQIVQRKTQ